MEASSKKRKADLDQQPSTSNKKAKGKKQWSTPRRGPEPRSIQPGDVGIWATCAMKKEAKCVVELRDLFEEYASKLYQTGPTDAAKQDGDAEDEEPDIEAEIKKELRDMRKPASESLFTHVRMDTQCLIFFKTRSPVEPVSFVRAICTNAANSSASKQSRFVKRLTPMTCFGKATEKGIEETSKEVLAPHFHIPEQASKKFAIRTSFRNNKSFTRDAVIKQVASIVGPGHKVDLTDYDLLILVEIYQNVVGMSVVGPDFEKLKRYNLAELYEPGPQDEEKAE